jgi:3-oxoacyl-[acyl-carrier-protein] synthase-3
MYAGADKLSDGSLRGWREYDTLETAVQNRSFLVKQDVKLLNENIVDVAVKKMLARLVAKHQLTPEQIDWFLPHYSSDYFRPELAAKMAGINFAIPEERWFTNLKEKGNTGSASIYVILEELFHSGRLKKGEKILCFIPESGRFSMCYALFTVV